MTKNTTDTNQACKVKRSSLNKSDEDVKLEPIGNQASEDELDTFMKQLGFFWDSYQSNWRNDGRKQFGIDYDDSISMQLAKQLLAHIRAEKLKLLAEVRERVIEDNYYQPDNPASDLVGHNRLVRDELRFEQRTALAKLEAEL